MSAPPRLHESLRAQLVEALAMLLVEDLERFPTLPGEERAEGEEPQALAWLRRREGRPA